MALEFGGEPLVVECEGCVEWACRHCANSKKAPADVEEQGPDVDVRTGYVNCRGSDLIDGCGNWLCNIRGEGCAHAVDADGVDSWGNVCSCCGGGWCSECTPEILRCARAGCGETFCEICAWDPFDGQAPKSVCCSVCYGDDYCVDCSMGYGSLVVNSPGTMGYEFTCEHCLEKMRMLQAQDEGESE